MRRTDRIRNLAYEFLGTVEEAQTTLLSALCLAADQELRARLRPGISPEDCEDSFVLAGALLCVSTLNQLSAANISDFTAGTMKISFSPDQSDLAALAYRTLEPWLADGFLFRGVRA